MVILVLVSATSNSVDNHNVSGSLSQDRFTCTSI